jgi:hypothetical protein
MLVFKGLQDLLAPLGSMVDQLVLLVQPERMEQQVQLVQLVQQVLPVQLVQLVLLEKEVLLEHQ